MASGSIAVKAIISMGLMAFAFLYLIVLGLEKSLNPSAAQRVKVAGDLSPFNGQRAYADLKEIVAIGPRVAGSEGGAKVRQHIRTELKEAGLKVIELPFSATTPSGAKQMVNVTGVIRGTLEDIIILGNHYDTKYLPDITFVGANDGGSTTAWMLEMARALGSRRQGYTIWLCFFDGEEAIKEWTDTDSLYGSRAMVAKLEEEGNLSRIKAMVNVDMIGDCYLAVFKDPDAPEWLTRAVWAKAAQSGYSRNFLELGEAVNDDHRPFRAKGVPALNIIDFRYGGSRVDHQNNWHTSRDTIDRVCAESLQAVGDVVYNAIPEIENWLVSQKKS